MAYYWTEKENRYGSIDYIPNIPRIAAHGALAFIALIVLFGSFGVVGPQERGIKVRLGVVRGVMNPGPYVKFPLIDRVERMDVKTQSIVSTREAPMTGASNDLQDTKLAVVVNYHIEPSQSLAIYQQYGSAETYYQTVVDPLIVGTIKATASQYTAAEQIQKRQEMSLRALTELQKAFEGKNVAIEKVDITDIDFDPTFKAAIEAKVTAVQQAEAAKNKLEQVKYEAQQQIETAKATAESQRIQAQSLAAQGGSDYVALKAIEKWNGAYPNTYMGPSSQIPLINLK